MQHVQIIQDPADFANKLANELKTALLPELAKEFQPKQPEAYLTRKEVADMFKVDISTIHNWCKKGKLNPHGIGSRVYFKRSEVEGAIVELNK